MITGNESIQQAIYRQTGEKDFRIATPFDLADRTIQHYISSKPGLTIRQHFAAMALASGSTPKDALLKADELIKLLNNDTSN